MIHFTDLDRESTYGQFQFDCHAGTTYEVIHLATCDHSLLLKLIFYRQRWVPAVGKALPAHLVIEFSAPL